MTRRRIRPTLTLLLVLGLAAGACADDGELGGPRVGGALAASVGPSEYTAADLEDDVDALAANPEFVNQAVGLPEVGEPGRRPSQLVAPLPRGTDPAPALVDLLRELVPAEEASVASVAP